MVRGEGYAEEDDELMMDYMENKGVGNEEIDRFIHGVDDSGFARRDAGQSKGQSQIRHEFETCGNWEAGQASGETTQVRRGEGQRSRGKAIGWRWRVRYG